MTSRSTCDLSATLAAFKVGNGERHTSQSPANEPLLAVLASPPDPLPTCDSAQTTRIAHLQGFSSHLPDSNRRPPPYHRSLQACRSCTQMTACERVRVPVSYPR